MDPLSELTFVIKSFLRPRAVTRCVGSILRAYPGVKVIVVDDGDSLPDGLPSCIRTITLPFDSGISLGRNIGVAAVETPYCVLADDDTVLDLRTDIRLLVEGLQEEIGGRQVDLCAGSIRVRGGGSQADWFGNFRQEGSTLRIVPPTVTTPEGREVCELALNWFAARTESLRDHPWDPYYKVGEHLGYFYDYRRDLVITHDTRVLVTNTHARSSPAYVRARGRAAKYRRRWLRDRGFSRVVFESGKVLT